MDTSQPKRSLKAFFKHATIRVSPTKDHAYLNDSASTHSIDDDSKSQRSSISGKKDSKLRRIGRGIREWRSKRKRRRGDLRAQPSFDLEGKSFSSSEASLPEGSFEEDEDFSDEDEAVDLSQDRVHEASAGWRREAPEEKLPCEIIHEEVAVRQSAREHVTSTANESQTRSRKEVTLPQVIITPPPSEPVYSSLVLPGPAPRDTNLESSGIVFRRDRQRAFDFAKNTLSSEPALWTDASHRKVGLKSRDPEHHGGIAVAQKLGQRWAVHSAYTSGVTDSMQLESLAILMALQRAAREKRSGMLGEATLGEGTLREGTVYICSDSDASLQWIERILYDAIDTAIRKVVQEACALEADFDYPKCVIRRSKQLDLWQVVRSIDHHRPEKNMLASIGKGILEHYCELRRLGAWVEFHWVPAHTGLPGNEIADRVAALSCWWLAKVAPRPAQGTGLMMPLKVLTFDEPWTRYCPHKGQRQYSEHMALQLLEETKNLRVVVSTKTITGPARLGPDGLALQPTPKSTCRLLEPPSACPFPGEVDPGKIIPEEVIPGEVVPEEVVLGEVVLGKVVPEEVVPGEIVPGGEAKLNPVNAPIRTEPSPNHNIAFQVRQQVGLVPQPPPPFPQPQPKVRREKQRKKRPTALGNLLCVNCWHNGHLIHQCFEKYPEQKLALPERYARYVGRPRLEKVMPGAYHSITRLHPQLMPRAIHGQGSRYMVGRVGLSLHLVPQCAARAVRCQAAQPGLEDAAAAAAAAAAAQSVQDYRQSLGRKYRREEAQSAVQLAEVD